MLRLAGRSTCTVRELPAEEVEGSGGAEISREGKQEDRPLKE